MHLVRGDARVREFDRASDAVCSALAFPGQERENRRSNESLLDDIRPEVRIGIGIGEVVIADETLTGAGVALAQLLEQLAVPVPPSSVSGLPCRGLHPGRGDTGEEPCVVADAKRSLDAVVVTRGGVEPPTRGFSER